MAIKLKRAKPLHSWMLLLMPFALLYWIITAVRNALFDFKIIRPARFSIPTIGVGNLSVGGTGKTPHIEYLIRQLHPFINVATLSRGYGRKTVGFREVMSNDTANESGDEALLYKLKYPELGVFVGEQRAYAIPQLMGKRPETQTILLDDIFQHRSVTPYLNILLTEYALPYFDDFLLPVGSLREWRSNAERADLIIVTKCPAQLSSQEMDQFVARINPLPHQKVFFSTYRYGHPYKLFNPYQRLTLQADMEIVLFTAIADTDYMLEYLKKSVSYIHMMDFPDHHLFTDNEVGALKHAFEELKASKKVILVTEKDAVKFVKHREFITDYQMPVYVLPIEVAFLPYQSYDFDQYIKSRLIDYTV